MYWGGEREAPPAPLRQRTEISANRTLHPVQLSMGRAPVLVSETERRDRTSTQRFDPIAMRKCHPRKEMTQNVVASPPVHYSRRVNKPWGHELILTPPELPYTGKLIHVSAGCRLSLQWHDEKTETMTLLSGLASLTLENDNGELDVIQMEPGCGYTVLRGRKHRLSAVLDSVVMEVSTPESGFTFRISDDFGRPDEIAGSAT